FKVVNDTFGHSSGDQVLRAVVEALRRCTRAEDTIGRLGGDEFIVLFETVTSSTEAEMLGHRIAVALDATDVVIGRGHRLSSSASVGVAWTTEPVGLTEFVARADRAMYQAKRNGRGGTWMAQDGDEPRRRNDAPRRRDIIAAVRDEQFELHYQPIVDLTANRVDGFEALLRWRHPTDGVVLPRRFLPLLLESGQIGTVGHWVVRTAVRQLVEW
ncbi:MAG: bifunctional diguanylate cyclase/phosphodiesterase, partial [Actinobacteria bacterium]|nr:bifunctional diguanylate cyclase/phosphodiesterase [Actinomycetota bacterium]